MPRKRKPKHFQANARQIRALNNLPPAPSSQANTRQIQALRKLPPPPTFQAKPKQIRALQQLPRAQALRPIACTQCRQQRKAYMDQQKKYKVALYDVEEMRVISEWKNACQQCFSELLARWRAQKRNPKYRKLADRYMMIVKKIKQIEHQRRRR